MQVIPLTQGYYSVVDDKDFLYLSKFSWRIDRNSDGKPAYAKRSLVNNFGVSTTVRMHSEVLRKALKARKLCTDDVQVDHINFNGLDNRKANIRLCTAAENQARTKNARNKSGYRGVVWNEGRRAWESKISYKGKRLQLGFFRKRINAAKAYNKAAIGIYKRFAILNKV